MNAVMNSSVGDVVSMEKRERIRLERIEGDRNRVEDAGALTVWFDTAGLTTPTDGAGILARVTNLAYTGVLLYPDNLDALAPAIPARMLKAFQARSIEDLARLQSLPQAGQDVVVASPDVQVLKKAAEQGLKTCYRAYVDDGASLHPVHPGRRPPCLPDDSLPGPHQHPPGAGDCLAAGHAHRAHQGDQHPDRRG
jgi:3-dehydroquinate synthase II/3-amino-4-hydroxybenzoic acid synthase